MYIVWAEYVVMSGIGNQKGELGASFISNAMANRKKGTCQIYMCTCSFVQMLIPGWRWSVGTLKNNNMHGLGGNDEN